MPDTIEFRGSYQYATESMLEAALANARERIGEELLPHHAAWSERFTRETTTLHIHACLPIAANELFAVRVLRTLANTAMTGAVEARRGDRSHEYYFVDMLGLNDNEDEDEILDERRRRTD